MTLLITFGTKKKSIRVHSVRTEPTWKKSHPLPFAHACINNILSASKVGPWIIFSDSSAYDFDVLYPFIEQHRHRLPCCQCEEKQKYHL